MDVMMIQVSKNQYSDALELLNEFLAKDPANYPVWLVVCGGAALQTHGIIQRATKDVDIFAERNAVTSEFDAAYPLSPAVQKAIKRVASILNLPENWLNAATSFFQLPLGEYPAYFWSDLTDEEYGSHVKVSYLSPRGLITLKTLAALQRDAGRDTLDLIALKPTESNMQEALDWCLSTTVNRATATEKIATLLTHLHHENLTQRYQA
jgi:hypothetical protein